MALLATRILLAIDHPDRLLLGGLAFESLETMMAAMERQIDDRERVRRIYDLSPRMRDSSLARG